MGHGRTEEEITETKIRKIGSFPSFPPHLWSDGAFLKSCKWLAFSRLSLLVNAVALAGNSTMRPINMCPEKFLPSCGTWRTIVTDRKVFAQVRIFSLLSSAVRLFLQSCLISVLFFHKGRKSFFKDERENALGRSDWSPSFAYHCPFSFKLQPLRPLPASAEAQWEKRGVERKFKGNGRQRKILSSKCPKWTAEKRTWEEAKMGYCRDGKCGKTFL